MMILSTLLASSLGSPPPRPLFSAGELNVTMYRIPVLVALPPDNRTLLAFAEARLPCERSCGQTTNWGDSSPKHIAFRRSTDGGQHWTPTKFIVRSNGTNDNLNLGNVVHDARKGVLLLQWGGCVHCGCSGTVPKPKSCADPHSARAMQLASSDRGQSWGPAADISRQVLSAAWPVLKFGEGSGVQLPATGELVVCGRVSNLAAPCAVSDAQGSSNCGSACIHSSDGGAHWQQGALIGGPVPGVPEERGNEAEPALLRNGSILLNMRAGNERILGRSDDGARSFVDVHSAPSLTPVANCQGSMASSADGSGTLFFTAPHGLQRKNLSLAISHDDGQSWTWDQVITAGPAAYSSLAPVSALCAALLFEGGSTGPDSDSRGPYEHIYFTSVCAASASGAAATTTAATTPLKGDDTEGGGVVATPVTSCDSDQAEGGAALPVVPAVQLRQLGRSATAHTSYPTGNKDFSVLESFPAQGQRCLARLA